ncbi:hypothetical protein PR048_018386 [Dryococelus australis]|uniref:Uncharacterized protein n=1 Tax=Dryococelus australis TaxID=614101 RepID=A0ABQ9HC97_9NEOP|nr:hypothetical protein PR048_018386 [Dryococelus australis]
MFFYAAKEPFNVAELDNFKEMIQILRPGYKAPKAKDIEKVQNRSITLAGWSSVKYDPIQAITIHTGQKDTYLKVYDAEW